MRLKNSSIFEIDNELTGSRLIELGFKKTEKYYTYNDIEYYPKDYDGEQTIFIKKPSNLLCGWVKSNNINSIPDFAMFHNPNMIDLKYMLENQFVI